MTLVPNAGTPFAAGRALKGTWEKVLEYASSPLHGTLSQTLRKGVSL